jgi:hypothetical protein
MTLNQGKELVLPEASDRNNFTRMVLLMNQVGHPFLPLSRFLFTLDALTDSLPNKKPFKKRTNGSQSDSTSDSEAGEGIALTRSRRDLSTKDRESLPSAQNVPKQNRPRKSRNEGDSDDTDSEEGGEGIALTRGRRNLNKQGNGEMDVGECCFCHFFGRN